MSRLFSIFSGLFILVFLSSLALAGIPKLINYQGMLTDNSGTPLTGSYNLTFKIWTDTTGGSTLWTETQNGVQVQNGLFNVILGRLTTVSLPFDQQYWLEVGVGGETMPRLRFTSVGYAYRAQAADTAISVQSYPHNHDTDYVNVIGPDSIRSTAADIAALRIRNYGSGNANGITIRTWGNTADGIYIDTTGDEGISIDGTVSDGVQMDNIHGDGVHITDVDDYGIYLDDVGYDGIYINDAGGNGLRIKLADHGVYIDSTRSTYDGMYIRYSEDDGVTVNHADDEGFYVGKSYNGVWVDSAGNLGIYALGYRGNQLGSNSSSWYALCLTSKDDLSTNPGLIVYGYGHITGGWSKSVPSKSGEQPAFSVCSPDVELIASGTETLVDGQVQVTFDPKFQDAISTEVPVRVVVTAQDAPSALLYVTNKSTRGFTVKPLEVPELSLETDSINFDWIVIARQKGYEQRPEVLIPSKEGRRSEEMEERKEIQRDALSHQHMLDKQAHREEQKKQLQEREKQEREN